MLLGMAWFVFVLDQFDGEDLQVVEHGLVSHPLLSMIGNIGGESFVGVKHDLTRSSHGLTENQLAVKVMKSDVSLT